MHECALGIRTYVPIHIYKYIYIYIYLCIYIYIYIGVYIQRTYSCTYLDASHEYICTAGMYAEREIV